MHNVNIIYIFLFTNTNWTLCEMSKTIVDLWVTIPPSCSDDLAVGDKTILHITEETDDDLLMNTPQTHTTEDLFTIIHRFAHVAHTPLSLCFCLSRSFSQSPSNKCSHVDSCWEDGMFSLIRVRTNN